jgi:chaperonin GroES
MNLKPISDHLVVKPHSEEIKTKSGIVLPDTVDKEKPETGEVLAVGPGRVLDNGNRLEMSVKVGQKILFKKYSPDEFKIDGDEFLVLSESDIIAIVE